MNAGMKNKVLVTLVILLLLANAATIAFFWWNRAAKPPGPKGSPRDFLVTRLKMNTQQTAQFDVLVKEHREAAEKLREQTREAKEQFFQLLRDPLVTDSTRRAAAHRVSETTEALDLLTLAHFQKVRALCTPEQQKEFDEVIEEVVKMMGQPRPPMGPGNERHGPPPGEGPPPR